MINNTIGTVECVISRYNEYINWIVSIPSYVSKIYIYNKGENHCYFKDFTPPDDFMSKVIFIQLPLMALRQQRRPLKRAGLLVP
jgi:hypothetical protein